MNKIAAVFPFMLRQSTEGGVGHVSFELKHAGRWAGDRIAVVCDYDESNLYQKVQEEAGWKEISSEIIEELNRFLKLKDCRP